MATNEINKVLKDIYGEDRADCEHIVFANELLRICYK